MLDIFTVKQWLFLLVIIDVFFILFLYKRIMLKLDEIKKQSMIDVAALAKIITRGHE